jgi:hypothetical protein
MLGHGDGSRLVSDCECPCLTAFRVCNGHGRGPFCPSALLPGQCGLRVARVRVSLLVRQDNLFAVLRVLPTSGT